MAKQHVTPDKKVSWGPIHKKIKCNEKCNENCNRMEFDSETYPNFSISPFHYIIFGPCESGMDS